MRTLALLAMLLVVSACATDATTPGDIGSSQEHCSEVYDKTQMLQEEKTENDRRRAAGMESFLPEATMARFLINGYETNTQVSTGEWANLIDAKLQELNLQRSCLARRQLIKERFMP